MALGILGGLLAATAYYSLFVEPARESPPSKTKVPQIAAVLIAISSLTIFGLTVPSKVLAGSQETAYDDQIRYLEEKRKDGAFVAAGYGVFSQVSALTFANGSSNKIAAQEIAGQYPRWIDFSIWNQMFYVPTPDGSVLEPCSTIEAMVRSPQGLLLAPGRPIDLSQPTIQYLSLVTATEARFGEQEVLRVLDIQCPSS